MGEQICGGFYFWVGENHGVEILFLFLTNNKIKPVEDKIIDWLNKTGYPLELWTESILSKNSFIVTNSTLYKDAENDIFREIDLKATRTWATEEYDTVFALELIIECKKSDKPFILLCNENSENKQISIGSYYGLSDPIIAMLLNNSNTKIELPQESNAGFKLIQGFVNGDETINKATNALIKSYNDARNNELEFIQHYIDDNYNSIILPILVIDAPFFELKTNINNELKLKKIESGILNISTNLSKYYLEPFEIPIVTKFGFIELMNEIQKFGKQNIEFLTQNPTLNISNFKNVNLAFEEIEETNN